jgi:hypothetical protein
MDTAIEVGASIKQSPKRVTKNIILCDNELSDAACGWRKPLKH